MKCFIAVIGLFAILATVIPDALAYPNQHLSPHIFGDLFAKFVMKFLPPVIADLVVILTYPTIVLTIWQIWGLIYVVLVHLNIFYEGGEYLGEGKGAEPEAESSGLEDEAAEGDDAATEGDAPEEGGGEEGGEEGGEGGGED